MVSLNEPENWLKSVRIVDKGDKYELLDKHDGRLACLLPKDDTPVYGRWSGFGGLKIDEAIERMEAEIEDYKNIKSDDVKSQKSFRKKLEKWL